MHYRVVGNKLGPHTYHNFVLGSLVKPYIGAGIQSEPDSAMFCLVDDINRVQVVYYADLEPAELSKQEAATVLRGAVADIHAAVKVAKDVADKHDLSMMLRLDTVDISYSGSSWSAL